jgi:VAD1 Analog of StAR-related lipid transfer domain
MSEHSNNKDEETKNGGSILRENGDDKKKKEKRKSSKNKTGNNTNNTSNPVSDMILQKVGYIVEEFKCSHNNFQGMLYAGPLAIVFLGRMLLFEWTVVVQWNDVHKVVKCADQGYSDNCIRIDARQRNSNETSKYYFERFFDCHKALGVLISLHNDSILDLAPTVTPKFLSRGLRRNNSDPLRISNLFNFDEDALLQPNEELPQDIWRSSKSRLTRSESLILEELRVSASSVPLPSSKAFHRSSTYNFSVDSAQVLHIPEGKVIFENDRIGNKIPPLASSESKGDEPKQHTNTGNLQEEWQAVMEDESKEYSETPVQDLELSCDLDTFLSKFVLDGAPCSMTTFMGENGDKDIQVTKWKQTKSEGSSPCFTRTIEYTHPVDAPMAPPMARARKEQGYVRYGDHGLIFTTKTYVSDVPMTDCFYVADHIRVESKKRKEGEDGKDSTVVCVSIAFDVRFVKSTMFRGIISRTTKSELEKFCCSLAEFLSQNLGSEGTLMPSQQSEASPVPASTSMKSTNASNTWIQMSVLLLLSIIVTLQGWMVWEIGNLKVELQRQEQALQALLGGSLLHQQQQQPQLRMVHDDL